MKLTETDKEVSLLARLDCCLEFAGAFNSFWYDCSTWFKASIAFQFLDLKSYEGEDFVEQKGNSRNVKPNVKPITIQVYFIVKSWDANI